MADQTQIYMTASEYFQLPETTQIMQLLDGEVIMSPAPLLDHQRIIRRLTSLLESLIPDGEIFLAPTDVKFDDLNIAQPDILWVSDENDSCIPVEGKYLKGAPDLCIEVLPAGTARQDKTTKFLLYEKHGVREYWLIDPKTSTLEVWSLEKNIFVTQGSYTSKDAFASKVLKAKTIETKAIRNYSEGVCKE